ncbi:hypothetical protein AC1031_007211 [Aphanomyces cochlioides]|nr:hypothetical protein AC1031_007211 [Aphanomyces cochlioides]
MASAESLLADGSEKFHELLATSLEASSGKAMPQVEIRFKDLSIAADVVLANKDGSNELPTLANHAKKSLLGVAAKKSILHKDILHPISGVFKPATMTLLLGQPSSGKSSFMKMLAGRFPIEKNIKVGGSIRFNGTHRKELVKHLPQLVSYMGQRDYHYPVLTVQETMEFAHQSCGGVVPQRVLDSLQNGTPEENAQAKEIIQALYLVYPDIVVRQLGLNNCKDTIVGDAMTRGVSGGESKRVTIGEMEFGMKQVSFMDEISTGLDSAATFDIVKSQRSMAKSLKKTIVIALLQPSPEVLDLFDDIMIMNEGYVMYHGPRSEALAYFESFGFKCPPSRDVADFLLDLGTPEQDQYVLPASAIYNDMMDHVEGPVHPLLLHDANKHMKEIPEFQTDFKTSTLHLIRRQTNVLLRNKAFLQSRVVLAVVMGLLYATTFYQVNPNVAQVMFGVIFQTLLSLGLTQGTLLPLFAEARAVFYKQRGANFFRTLSFVLAQSITLIPFSIAETALFGSIIYWISGFVADAGAFLMHELILLVTNIAFTALFFFIVMATPNLHVAEPVTLVSMLAFVLFAGFIIFKNDIPNYLIWIYWINPISWGMRALSINQYTASTFQVCTYRGVEYCERSNGQKMGPAVLAQFGMPSDRAWIWYCLIYMVVMYVCFVALAFVSLEYFRHENSHGAGGAHGDDQTNITDSDVNSMDDKGTAYEKAPATPSHTQGTQGSVAIAVQSFTPVTLAFKDLHYFVPNPTKGEPDLELIKGVSGYALPGTVTALMGSSGAGKTTLMDVIAGRKTGGKIVEDILLNGYPATDLAIRRCTGYCEQMDIHCESATFREALTFSAMLRQSSEIPTTTKLAHAEECIRLLEMQNIADKIIRGSSVEQMKRLTIGVELAAAPSVLFLDQPTSGLDARSAKIIMSGIRKIASTGRTVVCTIHQPSTEVFEMFDSETVFYGDLGTNSSHLIDYFMRIPGTLEVQPGYNPATWMLENIGAGVESKQTHEMDYVQVFKDSPEYRHLQDALAIHTQPRDGVSELSYSAKRAASNGVQCKYVLQRIFAMYWRTPSYNYTHIMLAIFLAVLFGLCYRSVDYTTYSGVTGGVGLIFLTVLFLGVIAFNRVMPLASEERASFYRERASQTYNALWYWLGLALAEIPYVLVSTFLFTVIFYPFVGFSGNVADVIIFGLVLSLYVLMNVYFGMTMVFVTPRIDVAASVGMLINSIFFLFMGFIQPAHVGDSKRLPMAHNNHAAQCEDGNGMDCATMKNVPPVILSQLGKSTVTVKEFTEFMFSMKYDNNAKYNVVVVGLTIVFLLLMLLSLHYVNHQRRCLIDS